jgi:hypothetical protein
MNRQVFETDRCTNPIVRSQVMIAVSRSPPNILLIVIESKVPLNIFSHVSRGNSSISSGGQTMLSARVVVLNRLNTDATRSALDIIPRKS